MRVTEEELREFVDSYWNRIDGAMRETLEMDREFGFLILRDETLAPTSKTMGSKTGISYVELLSSMPREEWEKIVGDFHTHTEMQDNPSSDDVSFSIKTGCEVLGLGCPETRVVKVWLLDLEALSKERAKEEFATLLDWSKRLETERDALDKDIERVAEELDVAVMQENWSKVSALTEKLDAFKDKRTKVINEVYEFISEVGNYLGRYSITKIERGWYP